MKLSLFALTSTFAVASAANCDPTKIAPLLTDSNVTTCTRDSGFSLTTPSNLNAEMTAKFCASSACKSVLTTVKGLGLGDCTLFGMNLESGLIAPTQTACAGNGNSTAAGSRGSAAGSAGGAATAGNNSTTTAPGTSGNNNNSGASPNTAGTPAPTTKSSASSIAMAASVACVAVVCAAFL